MPPFVALVYRFKIVLREGAPDQARYPTTEFTWSNPYTPGSPAWRLFETRKLCTPLNGLYGGRYMRTRLRLNL